MSRYRDLLSGAWGEPAEPVGRPSLPRFEPPEGAPVPAPRRCVFCGAALPAGADATHPAGDMRRCRACGGQDYDVPGWVSELVDLALEANRQRPVPPELSGPFSRAVLAGNEAESRAALARIEAWAREGSE